MNPFEQLLITQDHDTRLDQLAHKRESLPELTVLAESEQVMKTNQDQIDSANNELVELRRIQNLKEDNLASLEAKAAEIEQLLYGGSVTKVGELQDLQAELDSVKRRISIMEDEVLTALENAEPVANKVEALTAQHRAILDVIEDVQQRLTAAIAEIDAETAEIRAERDASVENVPPEVLSEYNRLRESLKGVGVARLERNRCRGCHLTLSAVEVDRIRHLPPGEVVHCTECDRILVR